MGDNLAQLVSLAQRGDLDAFGKVVERFQGMACAVAYTIVGDAHLAEDAAQEAFIEAYLCLSKLQEPAAFPGWFRRIVVKRSDRLVRGKQPVSVSLDQVDTIAGTGIDPATAAETGEVQRLVQNAIGALPDSDRLITQLFYLAGYSQREIADILELPATTVKKRLYHARQRLREQMDEVVHEWLQEQAVPSDAGFARTVQFFIAVRLGDIEHVQQYLVEDPALINAHERWDETTARQYGLPVIGSFTALHRAVFNDDHVLTAFLLAQGATIDAQTRSGQTPLHVAVLNNRATAVKQLIASGADPNVPTKQGMTPLHWAVIRGRQALADALLAAGADTDRRDQNGRTALDWARIKEHTDLLILLNKYSKG